MILNRNRASLKVITLFLLTCIYGKSSGQQMPFNPVSYRIFTPLILNPAIAGSKDYFSVDVIAGFRGKSYSQIIDGNTRLVKKVEGYQSTDKTYSFTNIGIGFSGYNEYNSNDSTHNAGISAGGSYHFPLGNRGVSFVSVGAAIKGMYHFHEGNPDLNTKYSEAYFPNADLGVYVYTPSLYGGLSVTNLLGTPDNPDTLSNYCIPVSRQYNLIAGYKILLSRSLNIILEPFVIIHTDDSLSFDAAENIEPGLKLYAGNFCIGTFFNDYSKVSFFFQYRYPKFYVGTFFALPKDSPFYKKSLTSEIAFGINFSHNRSGYTKNGHW